MSKQQNAEHVRRISDFTSKHGTYILATLKKSMDDFGLQLQKKNLKSKSISQLFVKRRVLSAFLNQDVKKTSSGLFLIAGNLSEINNEFNLIHGFCERQKIDLQLAKVASTANIKSLKNVNLLVTCIAIRVIVLKTLLVLKNKISKDQ